jgi:hypothetical protein
LSWFSGRFGCARDLQRVLVQSFLNLKNPVFCTDGVYPYKKRGWRAQRAGVGKTCTNGKSVRADRRLRTDDEAIRTQTTIFKEPIFFILK